MTQENRRQFLKNTATTAGVIAGAASFAAPALASDIRGPSDRIRIGLLGMGGRMHSHVTALAQMEAAGEVEIVAVCDCDQAKLDSLESSFPELAGKKLKKYSDMRAMFDDPSIDAVSNALGDRWHALSTIWACQSGKDVYVEKPGAHNLFEGRQMVAAARKYNRMVQHGTQNRSSPKIVEGIQKLKEGVIGDVYMGRGIDFKIRGNLGVDRPSDTPKGLDWSAWLGPKPMRSYSSFWHNRWYFNLELASGPFANQAVHEIDVLRWGLGLERHPTQITAIGGKWVHDDDRSAPTHVAVTFRFDEPDTMVTYEHRSWITNSEAGFRDEFPFVQPDFPVGTIFFGSNGYQIFPDYSSYYTFLGLQREPGPSNAEEGHPMADRPHFENWVAAIRKRDHTVLSADIADGLKSVAMCLLARTSYQVGESLTFDPVTETVDHAEANALLNEPAYREPFVVPKEV